MVLPMSRLRFMVLPLSQQRIMVLPMSQQRIMVLPVSQQRIMVLVLVLLRRHRIMVLPVCRADRESGYVFILRVQSRVKELELRTQKAGEVGAGTYLRYIASFH